ncbi:MAG: fibrillarin-like rRNA/tRNA 2'-O-methyltransferase [Nanoarchaeota archaeon]
MNQMPKFPNIYRRGRELYTKNAYPGITHFDEKTITENSIEYREFSPFRSKLAAAIANNISQTGIKEGQVILYLGASHGYTSSFISDIIGKDGTIFAIDFAPRVVRDLYFLSKKRHNIIPFLEDCNHPERYAPRIMAAHMLYQDIAQRSQVQIFLKNLPFLSKGGFGLLAIKARSIDVTRKPKEIFREVRCELEKTTTIVDYKELDPFEKDHALFVIKK